MKLITKPYITLRDRMWKEKEWFTSYRSYKNIRMLTEEEANSLDNIQEVQLKEKPTSGVVSKESGKMHCLKCGSQKGFYMYKMHRGKQANWYTMFECADCGKREKIMAY